MIKNDIPLTWIIGGGVVLAAVAYVKLNGGVAAVAGDMVDGAFHAVSPMNPENVFNRAATSVYQGVTGSDDSIGGDIYDFLHHDPVTGGAAADDIAFLDDMGGTIRYWVFGDKNKTLFDLF